MFNSLQESIMLIQDNSLKYGNAQAVQLMKSIPGADSLSDVLNQKGFYLYSHK